MNTKLTNYRPSIDLILSVQRSPHHSYVMIERFPWHTNGNPSIGSNRTSVDAR
ncbi:MAG: hypothetical protein AAFQ57_09535 [Cyanobacteria bacterium J06626_14]